MLTTKHENQSVRIYSSKPLEVAVIHGGPGAPGYMAPVARELSNLFGVIEPLQSAQTLDGQIDELAAQIKQYIHTPAILIGSSWGANLSLLLAAKYPHLVKRVILIGCSVFDKESSQKVKDIRAARMSEEQKEKSESLAEKILLVDSEKERNKIFAQMADCLFDADTFKPITSNLGIIECQYKTNKSVWEDFKSLRDTPGKLKKIHSTIQCPVVNIHGSYDPHIIEGIQPFLESCLENTKLYYLEKCGHYPWIEKFAKDKFFRILKDEINLEEKKGKNTSLTDEEIKLANVNDVQELNSKIELAEYDPSWPIRYKKLETIIKKALADLNIVVHHVGSTSVPGLCAKPIIDIILEVPNSSDESSYVPQLEKVGFWLKIREPDWFEHRMLKSNFEEVNLHVFTKDSSEVEKMINFKNHLIHHPEDLKLYENTKRELSNKTWKYTQNYADAKSEVVNKIFSRIN